MFLGGWPYHYAFTKGSGPKDLVLVFPLENIAGLELLEPVRWNRRCTGKDGAQDAVDLLRYDELVSGPAGENGIVEFEGEGVLNHDGCQKRENISMDEGAD